MEKNKKVILTERQQNYLASLAIGDIIKDIRLLKKFAKASFIQLDAQTGTQVYVAWAHCYTKCYYIWESQSFEINGYHFRGKYFDGCFKPFLTLDSKPCN
jgi:hypothetical protein